MVNRPTVVIISDEADFSRAITCHWQSQPDSPSFTLLESNFCGSLKSEARDLAIVGGLGPDALASVLDVLQLSQTPVLHVSRLNNCSTMAPVMVTLPDVNGWPTLCVAVASQLLECRQAKAALARRDEFKSQLEQEAALGRYMLEARHNFNNALTSVLGNSDLILLYAETLAPTLRSQVETIHNMSRRMNEIMQRFSSLQKEMRLVEQQVWKTPAKAAGA